jgi:hypothetical protein
MTHCFPLIAPRGGYGRRQDKKPAALNTSPTVWRSWASLATSPSVTSSATASALWRGDVQDNSSCARSDPCLRPNLQTQRFVALCCTRDTAIPSAIAILPVFLLIYLAPWGTWRPPWPSSRGPLMSQRRWDVQRRGRETFVQSLHKVGVWSDQPEDDRELKRFFPPGSLLFPKPNVHRVQICNG